MPAVQRQPTRFPALNRGFLGENNQEGLTDEIFQAGALRRCRNYRLIGRGRLEKRRGSQLLTATRVAGTGSSPVQQLMMYEWGSTRHLLGLCDGALKVYNAGAWDNITGSLTFASGQDNRISTTQFRDGTGNLIVGVAPGTGQLWKWNASGVATSLTEAGKGPQYAADLVEFYGSLWAIATNNGSTLLERSADQNSTDWPAQYYIHCSRESPGVGLSRHGTSALLVFHQRSVHAITFDASAATPWVVRPVDNNIGCISRDSIVYHNGVTYWAGSDGFYRFRSAARGAERIGHAVGEGWAGLNASRRPYITGFASGGNYPAIHWLVSDGSATTHNQAYVWHPLYDAWTIYESSAGYFRFNCGCDWVNGDGHHLNVLGDYQGQVWTAWGDDEYDTGYRDEGEAGAAVTSQLQTGLLDFGYPGIKRLKEGWIDAVVTSNRSFDLVVNGLGEQVGEVGVASIGVTGARLNIDFVLDASRLGSSGVPSPGQFQMSARSRGFQFTLSEGDAAKPHILNSMHLWWLPRSARFNP